MPGPTFIRGDRVTLRTLEPDDLDFIHRWQNDPAFRDEMYARTPRDAEQVEELLERWREPEDDMSLLVCVDGDPIGKVALFRVTRHRGELAYWLVPDAQGKGYATEAVSLLIDHAFDAVGLHKVHARVADFNEASRGLLASLGFTEEGRLREHAFVRGAHRDEIRYGLLRTERQ